MNSSLSDRDAPIMICLIPPWGWGNDYTRASERVGKAAATITLPIYRRCDDDEVDPVKLRKVLGRRERA